MPESELRAWLGSQAAWARGYDYTRFTIPKRRGGLRQIEAPGEKLKDLQRRILRKLLNPLPVPAAATGFVLGRSVVDNARPHVGQGVVINLDLADFFGSISEQRVRELFQARGWNAEAAGILARICTSDGRLPQGAPTSPALSNLACWRLDARLAALARKVGGHYTRYADDITLSLPALGRNKRRRPHRGPRASGRANRPAGPSRSLITWVSQIIAGEGFQIQRRKRIRIQRAHQRQTATGLIVNQKVAVPRATRRLVRAMQHRARLGKLDAAGQARLKGLEAWLAMVASQRERGSQNER
ncbi:MAG: reverse transcriptase domain-containing protein [Anaerolineales bacterium]